MQERISIDPPTPTAQLAPTPGPNGRTIQRVGLLQSVLEAMTRTAQARLDRKTLPASEAQAEPKPQPVNRHERRKAASLARRGR